MTVRVWVPDVWDVIDLPSRPDMTVAELKAAALSGAIGGRVDPGSYEVKFRGAAVRNEARTLGELAVPPGAPLVVLPARRRPVR